MRNPDTLEQARMIHETIQLLRTRIVRHRVRAMRARKSSCGQLTLSQLNAMSIIREREQITIKELAAALEVSAPSASAMVERLVEMGVVVRRQSEVDRREVRVSVSPGIIRELDLVERDFLESLAGLLERIGPDYARQWCRVYGRLHKILSEDKEGSLPA